MPIRRHASLSKTVILQSIGISAGGDIRFLHCTGFISGNGATPFVCESRRIGMASPRFRLGSYYWSSSPRRARSKVRSRGGIESGKIDIGNNSSAAAAYKPVVHLSASIGTCFACMCSDVARFILVR